MYFYNIAKTAKVSEYYLDSLFFFNHVYCIQAFNIIFNL